MYMTYDKQKKNQNKFDSQSRTEKASRERQTIPNSLVSRIMEDSQAEKEADRLSVGVTSTTPDEIMREMGSRLGADFSNVQFHSDSQSMNRSEALGARAWAQGSNVYFGKGGFDPQVAAHELVHTVQQGAVQGNTSESMPMGAVQLWPKDEEKDDINTDAIADAKKSGVDPLESVLLTAFNSQFGRICYRNIDGKLKEMIQKGAGKPVQNYSPETAVHFLVEGANRVHAAKEILQEIAGKPLESKDNAKDRAYEYKYFFKFLTQGLGEFGIEEIAVENQMNSRPAKYQHTRSTKETRAKRAWELENHSKDKENEMVFNPTKDPELTEVQEKIDHANDAKTAYKIFASFAGNAKGTFKDSAGTAKNLDVNMLKKKLKHMARVIIDYPELRGSIGDMKTMAKTKTVVNKKTGKKEKEDNQAIMGTEGTLGYRHKATMHYNAWMDRQGQEGESERDYKDWDARHHNILMAHRDYAGTHELGHVLASTLLDPEDEMQAIGDNAYHQPESRMLRGAASQAYMHNGLPMDYASVKTKETFTKKNVWEEADPAATGFAKIGQTSEYGSKDASEFFAEAVSDVYAHGKDAKAMSVQILKQYEKRRTDAVKKNFFVQQKKNKPGLFQKFLDLFRF